VDWVEIENGAGIGRVTCGWKRPELSLERVRPYWRDAHSPAIARRAGIYEYRHYPLDPVRPDLFARVEGIDLTCPADQQLMWLSDVRYADQAGLNAFGADPPPEVRARILADIEMIVDKSTTYLVLGENGRTLVDKSGDPVPAGPAPSPWFQVFFRRRGEENAFREGMRALAERWAADPDVIRLRLSLFETPDMEAERRAGYPVKTHPLELQYQAWIDLRLQDEAAGARLLSQGDSAFVAAAHAYPSPAAYTFNHNGRPTLIGLRGHAALEAIRGLNAEHQRDPELLRWMYGAAAEQEPTA
jgi:hypothetical protein